MGFIRKKFSDIFIEKDGYLIALTDVMVNDVYLENGGIAENGIFGGINFLKYKDNGLVIEEKEVELETGSKTKISEIKGFYVE
jgi:hypothetical protein